MQVAVISDIHLGRGDAADLFGHDDGEFLRFLGHLESNFERVILLGDIYETLTAPNPFAQAQELAAIKAAHPEIVERFENHPKYTYIHGNHDLIAANIDAAPGALRINVDGQRLLFTHGHGYDYLGRHARFLAEAGVWLGAWLCRMGMSALFRVFEKLDMWIRGAQIDPAKCSFQKWAVGLAEREQADIIVTGHTHQGVVSEHGNHLFMNSGSCSDGEFSFLSLDTKAGHYALNRGF